MSDIANFLKLPNIAMEGIEDWEEANDLILSRGWGDGLPLVPPTLERVQKMLQYCDRPWDEPIASIPPRNGEATPLRIAANAVMAGCRPEYFPVLLLAIEAMCEEPFNLYGVQTTTHPCAPLVIMNGPGVTELGINSGTNAFGPGSKSNATLGRAVRLCLLNIGGAVLEVGDMATLGHPGKYSFWVAENEAASPWEPLHVERGFSKMTTTVTVVGADSPSNVNDHESLTGQGILKMIAGAMANTGTNNLHYRGEPLVVISPEHATTIKQSGFSKQDIKQFLYENARVPLGRLSDENITRRILDKYPKEFVNAGPEALVPISWRPDDIMVIVMGGAGRQSAHIPTFGMTRAVTRALKLRDGSLANSVQQFRM